MSDRDTTPVVGSLEEQHRGMIARFLRGMADRLEEKKPQSEDGDYDYGWESADVFLVEVNSDNTLGDWLDEFIISEAR